MDVNGKVAIVTGGGSGIGVGLAEALLEAGARVAITDISAQHLAETRDRLGASLVTVPHDVASLQSWQAVKREVEDRLGPVDVLCNNAGICLPYQDLETVDEGTFQRVLAVNVTGVFNGCKTFLPEMKARGSGHIVNTASVSGLFGSVNFETYCASKFAVVGLSEALTGSLVGSGVGLSILYPGPTHSRMFAAQVGEVDREMAMEPIWLGRAVVRAIAESQLHIITHPVLREQVEARMDRLYAAFGEPAQPGFTANFRPSGEA